MHFDREVMLLGGFVKEISTLSIISDMITPFYFFPYFRQDVERLVTAGCQLVCDFVVLS